MHRIRSRKVHKETNKYLISPFEDDLIQLVLDKNYKCLHCISKDEIGKARELLKSVKNQFEMIPEGRTQKYLVKTVLLNTLAYFQYKQHRYGEALKLVEEAEKIEKDHGMGMIEMARTKLNKGIIVDQMGRQEQSIILIKNALTLLKHPNNQFPSIIEKNQNKYYDIMIISFYNIGMELSHSREKEAQKVYREGYQLAQRLLGHSHQYTHLLQSMVKSVSKTSKYKQKELRGSIQSNRSESINRDRGSVLIPLNVKQKQLKRIYAGRRKLSQGRKHNVEYYLRSLDKIDEVTIKKQRERLNWSQEKELKAKQRYACLITETGSKRFSSSSHQKIRGISINRNKLTKINLIQDQRCGRESTKLVQLSTKIPEKQLIEMQPLTETKIVKSQDYLAGVTLKVQEKTPQEQGGCQLY